ncbi:MAG TPA: CocE/NonD family hydrolase [Actinomycetota bacterium]|nr:CocE/NonD family hydrolase [Actinomycetota bacterium]
MRARGVICVVAVVATALVAPASATTAGEPVIEDNIVIESFDGTPIVATLMLPRGASKARPAPAVLRTHGWGGRRERVPAPGSLTERLVEEGYAVMTWDSRGFGQSGGEANVGSPHFEVKDAFAVIDYLARRAEIAREGPRDPLVGWTGGSNAAGVQFNTAALDRKGVIDAIVPEISWGLLTEDLIPNGVPKQGWNELLYFAGAAGAAAEGLGSPAGPQTGIYARQIHEGHAQINSTGDVSKEIHRWFRHKSTTIRSRAIDAPTLIIQGTVDTLFPLQDAFQNYLNLKAARTPVKLMTYCAGHTLGCPYPGGATGYPKGEGKKPPVWQERVVAWLDRYVKGDRSAKTGPEVEWQSQDGHYNAAVRYPLPGARDIVARTMLTGALVGPGGTGGDGATDGNPASAAEVAGVSGAREDVYGPAAFATPILGVPKVKLTGEVTGLGGFVFFELVDVAPDGARITVDDQVTPLRLGPGKVKDTIELSGISWMLQPGHSLELEITTGSGMYQSWRAGPYVATLEATLKLPLVVANVGDKA